MLLLGLRCCSGNEGARGSGFGTSATFLFLAEYFSDFASHCCSGNDAEADRVLLFSQSPMTNEKVRGNRAACRFALVHKLLTVLPSLRSFWSYCRRSGLSCCIAVVKGLSCRVAVVIGLCGPIAVVEELFIVLSVLCQAAFLGDVCTMPFVLCAPNCPPLF